MAKLLENVQKQEMNEAAAKTSAVRTRKSAVGSISGKNIEKDKQISAKVNSALYDSFTAVNKAQGMSNNSALNMLIARYVKENRDFIEDSII